MSNRHMDSRTGRREFLQALTAGGCLLTPAARALAGTVDSPSVLSGTQVRLTIEPLPVSITGRPRVATAVNGSVPGPILRLPEGEAVTLEVANRLPVPTSIHWHGVRLPADQDGVPGLSFQGIAPGETFRYRFPIRQRGTYWYHAHSQMQEQTGLYGALVLVPQRPEPYAFDREHVVLLSDWSDEAPMRILANLKQESDYYNPARRTLGTFVRDVRREGFGATLRERWMWGAMRMSPTDIADVSGTTYTFLTNGRTPGENWTGLFRPGETLRLRLINGSSMTNFDVRIPGLAVTVVAADGADVAPVTVDELRIGVAETYDVLVQPGANAYTLFAQAQDRSGFARGTLAPRIGMTAAVPALDPRALRTMADMRMSASTMADRPGMRDSGAMADMPGMAHVPAAPGAPAGSRLAEPGEGLQGNGRRVLTYADLRALRPLAGRAPERQIEFHLTGNMQRYVWGFDGRKFSESTPVELRLGERVRFVLVNDTMMEHPIHLHGFLFALDNGHGGRCPLKHTVLVKPAERMSFAFTADTPGDWAFHCHLLYHMESGMFRTVRVT